MTYNCSYCGVKYVAIARSKQLHFCSPDCVQLFRSKHFSQQERAWQLTHLAIDRGELIRQPCACGNVEVGAHHEDYTKPLDVVWMCQSCHIKHHSYRNLGISSVNRVKTGVY